MECWLVTLFLHPKGRSINGKVSYSRSQVYRPGPSTTLQHKDLSPVLLITWSFMSMTPNALNLRPMSHEAIYRQPVPGNLQEEKAFTFECSRIFLRDRKTLFEKLLMCYRSGPVECTAVGCLQVACKNCLV